MTGERGGGESDRDRERERERERHRLRRGIVCSIQVSFSMNASLSQRDYKLFRAVIGSGPFLFFSNLALCHTKKPFQYFFEFQRPNE